MFLKLLRGGARFTAITVAGRVNFCWKKDHCVVFQPPFNYRKRDDEKSSFFFPESHAGLLLSCVCVCDPNSFLTENEVLGHGADSAGRSEEEGPGVEVRLAF